MELKPNAEVRPQNSRLLTTGRAELEELASHRDSILADVAKAAAGLTSACSSSSEREERS